jgi:hypothetical protein
MSATYDIFMAFADGGPIWIEAVQGLENAKARLMLLHEAHSGDYFVYDPTSSKIVATAAQSEQEQETSRGSDHLPSAAPASLQTSH